VVTSDWEQRRRNKEAKAVMRRKGGEEPEDEGAVAWSDGRERGSWVLGHRLGWARAWLAE